MPKRAEKIHKCLSFYNDLKQLLPEYTSVQSSNRDKSKYLVPEGTEDQITYYSKPAHSFRVSDHWNWYSSHRKCKRDRYIQCWCVDFPYPSKRPAPGEASKPRRAAAVAFIEDDGKYHTIYGEKFNRKEKRWIWIESDPKDVVSMVRNLKKEENE